MDDWANDPAAKVWIEHVLSDMVPKMKDSAVVAQLIPGDEGEVKFWVELGASIMMDKPIVAVAFEGRSVPKKLRMIADEIVVLPEGMNPEGAEEFKAALNRVLDKLEDK